MSARLIRMLPSALPEPPAAAPQPADNAELLAAVQRQNQLLEQVLAELQKKKRWSFLIAKDKFSGDMHVDATQT